MKKQEQEQEQVVTFVGVASLVERDANEWLKENKVVVVDRLMSTLLASDREHETKMITCVLAIFYKKETA